MLSKPRDCGRPIPRPASRRCQADPLAPAFSTARATVGRRRARRAACLATRTRTQLRGSGYVGGSMGSNMARLTVLAAALGVVALAAGPASAAEVIVVDGERAARFEDPLAPSRAEAELGVPAPARARAARSRGGPLAVYLVLRRQLRRGRISRVSYRGVREDLPPRSRGAPEIGGRPRPPARLRNRDARADRAPWPPDPVAHARALPHPAAQRAVLALSAVPSSPRLGQVPRKRPDVPVLPRTRPTASSARDVQARQPDACGLRPPPGHRRTALRCHNRPHAPAWSLSSRAASPPARRDVAPRGTAQPPFHRMGVHVRLRRRLAAVDER